MFINQRIRFLQAYVRSTSFKQLTCESEIFPQKIFTYTVWNNIVWKELAQYVYFLFSPGPAITFRLKCFLLELAQ